jgi:hypothetical protein
LGIPGVLVATVLIGLIRRPILAWYTAKICGLAPLIYFAQAYVRPLCCFVITLFGAVFIHRLVHIDSYFRLGVCGGLVAMIWGLGCWFIGLTSREKALCLRGVTNQLNRKR